MKIITFFVLGLMITQMAFSQLNVGIGTATPAASAKLDVSSTTQGMLVPRMTTAQRAAIASPATGLLVFDVTTNSFWYKGNTAWLQFVDSLHTEVHRNGTTMIYTGLTENVGVGVLAPANKLDVHTGVARSGIQSTGRPLYVTGSMGPDNNGIEFMHANGTQGIGFGFNTIYAAGSQPNQDIGLTAKGALGVLKLSTNATEKMRITGDGKVGIGLTSPDATLEIARGTAPFGTLQIDGTNYNSHFNYGTEEDTYIRGGKPGSKVIINEYGSPGNVGVGTANPLQKLHVGGKLAVDDKVGIGNTDPHAPLQFSQAEQNRKIVLYENNNNDHEFFGFGVNSYTLRYQVPAPDFDHIFYSGAGASSSNELMRITGKGPVGIGVGSPDAMLEITRGNTTDAPFGTLQIDGTNHNSHFNYGTPEDTYIRGGKEGSYVLINDIAELGNVGIGTATPLQKLHVGGSLAVDNKVGIGFTNPVEKLEVNGNAKVTGNAMVSGEIKIGYTVKYSNYVVPGPTVGATYSCNCDPGTKAIGGGWAGAALDVIGSYASADGSAWNILVNNVDIISSHALTVNAVCVRIGN